MSRAIERLSSLGLGRLARRKGVFCDGGGLYLHSDHQLNVRGSFATD